MSNRLIHDEFSGRPVSRQRLYQLRKKRDGLCQNCGRPRQTYANWCDACQAVRQARLGHRPWRPGHIGRPPNSARAQPPACRRVRTLTDAEARAIVRAAIKAGLLSRPCI